MNIKSLLPFRRYTIQTNLDRAEVGKRITENTQESRGIRLASFTTRYDRPYSGKITGNRFIISRNLNYRNSFQPVIKGEIGRDFGKTEVNIRMHPHGFVVIFMCTWLGLVGIGCISILVFCMAHFREVMQKGFSPFLLIPFGMFAFGYLMIYFGFTGEAKKTKAFLHELLEGEAESKM